MKLEGEKKNTGNSTNMVAIFTRGTVKRLKRSAHIFTEIKIEETNLLLD